MDLTVGNPFSCLMKFAIPVIIGNLFQLFYTLADSVIVGKTLGTNALAAVGSTSIIIYFVLCFINGLTGGFGICLGQRCGAKDASGMRQSIASSTLLSILFSVLLTAICCLSSHALIRVMQIPQARHMTICLLYSSVPGRLFFIMRFPIFCVRWVTAGHRYIFWWFPLF